MIKFISIPSFFQVTSAKNSSEYVTILVLVCTPEWMMREFHMAHATCRLRSVDPASILWMETRTTRSGVDHRFCTNCTANQLDSSTAYLILEHLVAERFPFPAPKLSSCEGVVGFSLSVPNSNGAPSVGQSGERRCGILVSKFTQWGCYRFRWRRNS